MSSTYSCVELDPEDEIEPVLEARCIDRALSLNASRQDDQKSKG